MTRKHVVTFILALIVGFLLTLTLKQAGLRWITLPILIGAGVFVGFLLNIAHGE